MAASNSRASLASFAKGAALDGPVEVSWGDGWHYDGNQAAGQFSGAGVLVNGAKDRFDGNLGRRQDERPGHAHPRQWRTL